MYNNISGLPDELLVKVLSFVPTKKAVSTSILSRRWKFLWMWLPKLDYTGREDSLLVLGDFINKNLPLHRAPVIESLHLHLCELRDPHIKPQDIKLWLEIAVSRHVRELEISYYPNKNQNMLPSSLFTGKSLVTLKLRNLTLMDVPTMVCLPSLKTLQLESLTYADDVSFQALLSICPVLEDLDVHLCEYDDKIHEFTITIRSLLKLSLYIHTEVPLDRYEIDTPSLEYLKVRDWNKSPCLFKSMPNLREAHLDVHSFALKSVIGSVTSVKHLAVCSEDVYGDGIVFDQLEHLELCVCTDDTSNLLAQFLKASPKLKVLDMCPLDSHGERINDMVSWNQPSCVPECLLSSLQIFNWSPYYGRPQDRDIAVYILKNAHNLRTATIWANTFFPIAVYMTSHDVPELEMIKELTLSSRASSTCELVFIE